MRWKPRHLAVLAGKTWRRWQEGTFLPWAFGRLRAWAELPQCRHHCRALDSLGPPRPWA